jgi:ABC-type glycerol-3-phosphate transport system substrate-binding protein
MILLILVLTLAAMAGTGCAAVVAYIVRTQRAHNIQMDAVRQSNEHQNALRAIELAKRWEMATRLDTTPQLTNGNGSQEDFQEIIKPSQVETPITVEDVQNSNYDATLVTKFLEQEQARKQRQ